jgi:uncharacterized membrane protein
MATRPQQRQQRRSTNGSAIAARTQDGKTPVTALAGPYGHPFHPIFVTIPIGAWIASLLFDIGSRVTDGGSAGLVMASHWLILIGIAGAAVAAVFGLLDLLAIPTGTKAFRTGITHMLINVVVLGAYVVSFFWRHGDYDEVTEVSSGQIALSVVALALLAVSGWLGGHLAYRYGVRVAREEDQREAFLADARR